MVFRQLLMDETACVVSRVDEQVVGQREESLVERAVEGPCRLLDLVGGLSGAHR